MNGTKIKPLLISKSTKVSFEEAKTVFADSFAIMINDPQHSVDERRYIATGASADGKILVVSYTELEQKNPIHPLP